MFKKLIVAVAAAGAALSVSSQALALDCHNISRDVSPSEVTFASSAPSVLSFDLGFTGPQGEVWWNVMPDFKGNWYLLMLSEGGPAPATTQGVTVAAIWWGFIPPGTVSFFPGGNGNYMDGRADDLLANSACPEARQLFHGIQSGACGGIASLFAG